MGSLFGHHSPIVLLIQVIILARLCTPISSIHLPAHARLTARQIIIRGRLVVRREVSRSVANPNRFQMIIIMMPRSVGNEVDYRVFRIR